jgi:hypothetical protein
MAIDAISDRVQELKDRDAAASTISMAQHLKDLKSLRNQCVTAGQFGAAIAAEQARGRAAGLYNWGSPKKGDVAGKDEKSLPLQKPRLTLIGNRLLQTV